MTEAIINLATRVVVDRFMLWLATSIPFLATGPLGWIVRGVAGHFIGKILAVAFEAAEDGIVFLGINIQVEEEHRKYARAYQAWVDAPPEEKKNAQDALDRAFDEFVSFK